MRQLAAADLAKILEDNYGLLSNLRRTLARQLLRTNPRAHVRQRLPYAVRHTDLALSLVARLAGELLDAEEDTGFALSAAN